MDQSGAWHSPCGRYGQGCRFHKPAAGWVFLLCHFLLSEGPLVLGTVGEALTLHFFWDLERRRKMVKAASPSPPLGLAFCFWFGLSWLRAEPSTGQGLTEAKDIPGCHSSLCPRIGARESQMYPFLSCGSRIRGLQVQSRLRGGDRVALIPPRLCLSLQLLFLLINGSPWLLLGPKP